MDSWFESRTIAPRTQYHVPGTGTRYRFRLKPIIISLFSSVFDLADLLSFPVIFRPMSPKELCRLPYMFIRILKIHEIESTHWCFAIHLILQFRIVFPHSITVACIVKSCIAVSGHDHAGLLVVPSMCPTVVFVSPLSC
jgi:hypothetical protein